MQVYVGDDGKLEGPEVLSQELIPCSAWEYDKSFWQKTVIMDFDLVCDVSPQLTNFCQYLLKICEGKCCISIQ